MNGGNFLATMLLMSCCNDREEQPEQENGSITTPSTPLNPGLGEGSDQDHEVLPILGISLLPLTGLGWRLSFSFLPAFFDNH